MYPCLICNPIATNMEPDALAHHMAEYHPNMALLLAMALNFRDLSQSEADSCHRILTTAVLSPGRSRNGLW